MRNNNVLIWLLCLIISICVLSACSSSGEYADSTPSVTEFAPENSAETSETAASNDDTQTERPADPTPAPETDLPPESALTTSDPDNTAPAPTDNAGPETKPPQSEDPTTQPDPTGNNDGQPQRTQTSKYDVTPDPDRSSRPGKETDPGKSPENVPTPTPTPVGLGDIQVDENGNIILPSVP